MNEQGIEIISRCAHEPVRYVVIVNRDCKVAVWQARFLDERKDLREVLWQEEVCVARIEVRQISKLRARSSPFAALRVNMRPP